VDGHDEFRRGLCWRLTRAPGLQIVADESNGRDAILRVRELRPHGVDLVLMDIDMPIMNGIAAAAEITATDPSLPVIILTDSILDRDLFSALDSGAVGFLNKTMSAAALIRTLRDFHCNGSVPMSRRMAARALAHLQRQRAARAVGEPSVATGLTVREQEVVKHIAHGAHDHEIAAALLVAETTVKTHVRNILRKVGARNRAEAVARFRGTQSVGDDTTLVPEAPAPGKDDTSARTWRGSPSGMWQWRRASDTSRSR